ncbi:MAG: SsrA-binding protein SmpB [Fimbriimonadaceae bacterium]
MAKKEAKEPKSIVNRKARFEFELHDTWEAGIALVGAEVKSVFNGRVNMTDAFCKVVDGELWLIQLDIEPYDHSSAFKPERRRDRKLLLHKKEIIMVQRKSQEKGFTIVPTKVYFKNGRVKIEIALARGKKHYDKREAIAKNDARRELERGHSDKF